MQDPRGLARRRLTGCLTFPQETLLVGQGTLSCSLRLAPEPSQPGAQRALQWLELACETKSLSISSAHCWVMLVSLSPCRCHFGLATGS